jgi:hypothetical protein
LVTSGVVAKDQNPCQIAVKGGGDALTVVPWTQLNAVDQGAEHLSRLGPDVGVVQCLFELLDFFGIRGGYQSSIAS